jgi:hypothetical protein
MGSCRIQGIGRGLLEDRSRRLRKARTAFACGQWTICGPKATAGQQTKEQ